MPAPEVLDLRGLTDAQASGVSVINVTMGYVAGPFEPFEHSVSEIAWWDARIRANSGVLLKVLDGADIDRARRENKIGIVYGFQNAAMMGEDSGRVSTFARLGVRIIQLTYNIANQLGDGSMAAENRGLTDFGRDVVAELNSNRVLVDLSHSGEQTCLDAIKLSTTPVAITHSGCRALADLPRNKTDEELREMANRGGVVGIYFMPFLKVGAQPYSEDVVAHIEHAIDVCGEDHVGIGSDGSVASVDDMDAYRVALAEEVESRRAAGIGATGESADVVPFIPDLRGPDQYRRLADLLADRGHSKTRIDKILGENFQRLMGDVWSP
jgi:membrane dipeptidase